MDIAVYKEAMRLEATDPARSMRLYSELKKENKEFHYECLVFETALPLLTFLLARYLSIAYGVSDWFVSLFVWFGLGFMPLYIMSLRRRDKERGLSEKEAFRRRGESRVTYYLYAYVIGPLVSYFFAGIVYVFLVVVAAVFAIALHYLVSYLYHVSANIPLVVAYERLFWLFSGPVIVVVFTFLFFWLASNVPFRRMFSIREVFVGVKVNSQNILLGFRDLAVLMILGGGSLGMFFERPLYGIAASLFIGLTSGLSSAWRNKDQVLGELLNVSRIRGLIYSGRRLEARYLMEYLIFIKESPREVNEMLDMIRCYFSEGCVYNPHDYATSLGSDSRYQDLYDCNFSLTEDLVSESNPRTETIIPHDGEEYRAIGRVTRSGYRYPEGADPDDYEQDEYEYYKSGKWLDVEILSGKVRLARVYRKGDEIHIWGCDITDFGVTQIFGDPEAGDLVGYHTYYTSFGSRILAWSKIDARTGE